MTSNDKGFKQLVVWQKAYAFAIDVYRMTADFPKQEQL